MKHSGNKSSRSGHLAGLHDERGIALVLVLWFTLVIALVAASVTRTSQADVRIAANLLQSTRAEMMADGGVYLAVAALLKAQTDDPWQIDGTAREVEFDDGIVHITIRDEAQKLDTNNATALQIEEALLAAEFTPDEALRIAAMVTGARQAEGAVPASSLPRRGSGARTGNLTTPRTLKSIAGLGEDDYRRVRDIFTVYQAVYRAPAADGSRSRARRSQDPQSAIPDTRRDLRAGGTAARSFVQPRSQLDIYAITAVARLENGATFQRHAIVQVRGGQDSFIFYHWD